MGYVGEYAYCPHCNEKFHTDYKYHPEYNKKKEWMGYMVIQGKNTITVKS
jgi:RNA polymerase subunit RPABC4/transcription elongation factor Spt4